jgi:RNA polymerase sigma-70 factor (ECF subfamily)
MMSRAAPTLDGADDELAARARHEPEVFTRLYDRYLPSVYRYLYAKTGSPADAEDLTAQVFLAALEGLARYRPGESFRAWLFGIARRKAADEARLRYRRRAREASIEDAAALPSPLPLPLAQVMQAEQMRRLEQVIARLAEDEQELLRLRFAAGLGFSEMAAALGKKESAVKMALYRLLERLEREMEVAHA